MTISGIAARARKGPAVAGSSILPESPIWNTSKDNRVDMVRRFP